MRAVLRSDDIWCAVPPDIFITKLALSEIISKYASVKFETQNEVQTDVRQILLEQE